MRWVVSPDQPFAHKKAPTEVRALDCSAYRMRRGHYAASVTRLAVSQPVDRFTVQLLDGGRVLATRCLQAAGADLRLGLFDRDSLQSRPMLTK